MLAESGGTFSVTELSNATGLPPSHVCRLLKTMVRTGYIEQLPENRKYRVSLKLLHLSQARLMKLDLRRIGHPFVAQLSHDLKAPVFLSAPCQGRSLIVDVVWPIEARDDPVLVVGQIHSVRHSACGKVCAAFTAAAERQSLDAEERAALGDLLFADWLRELARIRETRLAVRQEQGLLAVAAPLFRAGGLFTGAIGSFFPGVEKLADEVEQAVRRTATALSFALGQPFAT